MLVDVLAHTCMFGGAAGEGNGEVEAPTHDRCADAVSAWHLEARNGQG